jgi:hypothetical protein
MDFRIFAKVREYGKGVGLKTFTIEFAVMT